MKMKEFVEHHDKMTGRMVEHEMLGELKFKNKAWDGSYIPYKESVDETKRAQPFDDPSDPEPFYANDLHSSLAEKLAQELDGDYGRLKFFTAVSGPLDIYHGIDAFFEIDFGNRIERITIDLTSNPKKEECKADVLIRIPAGGIDPKADKEEYHDHLQKYAQILADAARKKHGMKTG